MQSLLYSVSLVKFSLGEEKRKTWPLISKTTEENKNTEVKTIAFTEMPSHWNQKSLKGLEHLTGQT